jgi:hypothetical protein
MKMMLVSKASQMIGECDQRMWCILFTHVDQAYSKLNIRDVVWIGAGEMSVRKDHRYLTVFAYLMKKLVIFATEAKI